MNKKIALPLKKDKLYILAISGGVDSMSLLHYFYANGYSAVVVSFDHQTRDETKDEINLVKKYANIYNYPFYSYKLEIDLLKGNFHQQARIKRYNYLKDTANKYNTNLIVTGHHFNDLCETIIMRMLRTTTIHAYSGMQPIYNDGEYHLLKPFLFTTKEEIINYARNNNIDYLEDFSNFETNYTRNYIRHKIIPLLSKSNTFYRSILDFYYSNNKLSKLITKELDPYLTKGEIRSSEFNKLTNNLKLELLTLLSNQYNYYPTSEHLENIAQQIASNKPNIIINWGLSNLLIKSYNKLSIIKQPKLDDRPNIIISHNRPLSINLYTQVCYNKLDFPLVLRKPLKGEKLAFPYGHKKLSKHLIDLKVPKIERENLWILVDQNNTIVYIHNIYTNKTLGDKNIIYIKTANNEGENHNASWYRKSISQRRTN